MKPMLALSLQQLFFPEIITHFCTGNGIPEVITNIRTGNFYIWNWLMWASVCFYSFNLEQAQWSLPLEFSNIPFVNVHRVRHKQVVEVKAVNREGISEQPTLDTHTPTSLLHITSEA